MRQFDEVTGTQLLLLEAWAAPSMAVCSIVSRAVNFGLIATDWHGACAIISVVLVRWSGEEPSYTAVPQTGAHTEMPLCLFEAM